MLLPEILILGIYLSIIISIINNPQTDNLYNLTLGY
jgi:hypothetical protein